MVKVIVSVLIGIIVGALLFGIILWNTGEGIMMMESESLYDFDETVNRLTQATKKQGWELAGGKNPEQPGIINLQKSLKTHLPDKEELLKVKVLSICKPEHAYEILAKDKERIAAAVMPCRIAIYEKSNGKTYVCRMNNKLMAGMMNGVIPKVMSQATKESEEILDTVLKKKK
jgi:uncharacterized protein (DUF302 family)